MRALPFLTFQPAAPDRGAAAAMAAYVEIFDGRVISDRRRTADEPGGEGTVFLAEIEVAGLRLRFSDSAIAHAWDITPGMSVWVDCDTEADQRRVFAALAEDGQEFMPLGDYGFGPFGWVQDRFGVSWQVGVASA
ncbi:VOC family protein [Williamsia deligens]|uniref:VOC family protein n=1 Tax=Williamsia deligens TaxID=321325 RepID=A0ABW3G5S4_9NOCA|nr:VOC family protein [Williamsia deligens]MCP2194860.1 Glyoxalase superfamily enzyme, possibly 3-demethylubiquinone-9 3-methyltransferase [Williamsia deligens]